MPRIPNSLLLRARNISPLLPLLLRTCRTLPSAYHELKWLREYVLSITGGKKEHSKESGALLLYLCGQRSKGVPLQYLIGTQPFGELDILCQPGVLIPRPETEAYTTYLAKLVLQDHEFNGTSRLKVLDICAGTGCISLLLHALLSQKFLSLQILGIDISDGALRLARDNLAHNIRQGHLAQQALYQISFVKANVLSNIISLQSQLGAPQTWDIIISNPPYISQEGFGRDTSRSVRNWEPKLALVPPIIGDEDLLHLNPEDVFYNKILEIAKARSARAVLMEVGDMQQALRVVEICLDMGWWSLVEVWRDWPDQTAEETLSFIEVGQHQIRVRGSGHGRSVFCRR